MRAVSLGFAGWLLASVPVVAADLPDLAQLDRRIAREPHYTARMPLYGLLAFGPRAEKHVWLVLDRSRADAPFYDVLYVNRNADGNLTAPDARLAGTVEKDSTLFKLPEFRDPATGQVHTAFSVRVEGREAPTVMVGLKWQGKRRMGGGYPTDASDYMHFAPRPDRAPVLWFQGDGPFRFQPWHSSQLTVGDEDEFRVFIGQVGWGPASFCCFQEHVLPTNEAVSATLIYRDRDGRERRLEFAMKERC
jgi:hypothetical protein